MHRQIGGRIHGRMHGRIHERMHGRICGQMHGRIDGWTSTRTLRTERGGASRRNSGADPRPRHLLQPTKSQTLLALEKKPVSLESQNASSTS